MAKLVSGLLFTVAGFGAPAMAEHVVVIGLDGCRPDLLRDHSKGALRRLWQEGAYTWEAQAAVPSVTQVNFATMLTSCVPAKHGITEVAWDHEKSPKLRVNVTTIFEALAARGLSAAAFLGHEKLYPVEKPAAGIAFLHSPHSVKAAAPLAAAYLRDHRPAFTFVYFGDLDGVGHNAGWMSPEQIATLPAIEQGVELVVAAIRETSMNGRTMVIVTSDHGGLGRAHSTGRPEDRLIPWVCWGAHVKPGPLRAVSRAIGNVDTAATALYVLGVTPPVEWDGQPVTAAFAKSE